MGLENSPRIVENEIANTQHEEPFERRPHSLARCSSASARERLPFSLATRFSVLPLSLIRQSGGRPILTVAVGEEPENQLRKEIRFVADAEVEFEISDAAVVERAIYLAYQGGEERVASVIKDAFCKGKDGNKLTKSSGPELLNAVIDGAIGSGASDIHLFFDQSSFQVRYRVDGRLRVGQQVEGGVEVYKSLVRRVKVLAKLDTTQDRVPQEGAFSYRLDRGEIRLRISILPASGSEKIVIRLLDDQDLLIEGSGFELFERLGFSKINQQILKIHLMACSGLILCAGPTGSGKSTSLAAMIKFLDPERRNIVTVEDPIERKLNGVCQVELDANLDFEQVLPVVLRQDPDVVVIGEIRNRYVAKVAVQAALTGHLVLSTIHASDSVQTILRLQELGISPSLIGSALRLVINQRLLPLNCPNCLRETEPDGLITRMFNLQANHPLRHSEGCSECDFSGVRGRKSINGFLSVSHSLKKRLGSNNSSMLSYDELKLACQGAGRSEFFNALRADLVAGIVSPSSALQFFDQ